MFWNEGETSVLLSFKSMAGGVRTVGMINTSVLSTFIISTPQKRIQPSLTFEAGHKAGQMRSWSSVYYCVGAATQQSTRVNFI